MPQRIFVLGCPIDNLSLKETHARIDEIIAGRVPSQHVVINVDKILKIRRDSELLRIVSACDLINPDGMPVVWASRLLGTPLKERIAGIDLMEKLVERSQKSGYRLYFLGAREDVIAKVIAHYRRKYPGIDIAGYRNGYWDQLEEGRVVENIRQSGADILFVAISSPKKELFLNRYLKEMGVPFVMGVGGSFDVVAAKVKRAPLWMQKAGLEWFFRFCQEPHRLWRRYLIGNTAFLVLLCKEVFRYKVLGKRSITRYI